MLKINIQKRLKGKGNFELHVNLDIPGDFGSLVLFGPSGSGKTLTLRCIAGLARPDQGFLAFNGHVFFDSAKKIHLSPQKRHVGYLPQDYALFPHLTLLQNVAYGRSGLFARFMRRGEKERALSPLENLESPDWRPISHLNFPVARSSARPWPEP